MGGGRGKRTRRTNVVAGLAADEAHVLLLAVGGLVGAAGRVVADCSLWKEIER